MKVNALTVGNTQVKNNVFLAPMAGYTDYSIRNLQLKLGIGLCFTELVSAKGLIYGSNGSKELLFCGQDYIGTSAQIFGEDAFYMRSACESEHLSRFNIIDINMGCPVHKIYSNGEGSALMKNPDLIYEIVRGVSQNIDIPCTVKIRAGVDRDTVNAVECALAAEAGGASLVVVHGRTKTEMYSGSVDYEIIKNVKKSLKIPVVANGDITDAKTAISALSKTGADGIMIGRGAIGNPFVFAEIKSALSGEDYSLPSLDKRIETALLQLKTAIIEKGESVAVREARKQIAMYLRSFRGAAALRAEINRAESYSEIEQAFCSIREENGDE